MKDKLLSKCVLFVFAWILITILVQSVLNDQILGYDFPYIWHAGNALLVEGENPYSEEVAQRIFFSVYHRESTEADILLHFMYPIYTLFASLPLFFIPLGWAATAWSVLFVLIIVSFVPLLFPEIPGWIGITLLFFYEVWFTVLVGNNSLVIFMIFNCAFYILLYRHKTNFWDEILLGVALAWATGKPQMVWLLIPTLLLISLRLRKMNIIYGFFGALFVLITFSFLLQPDWLNNWLEIISSYPEFGPGYKSALMSFLYIFFSRELVWLFTIISLVIILGLITYFSFLWWHSKVSTIIFVSVCVLTQNLFDLTGTSVDRLVLIIPLLLVAADPSAARKAKIFYLLSAIISNLLFFLPTWGFIEYTTDQTAFLVYAILIMVLVIDWNPKTTELLPSGLPS